jgi:hypothetical protein
VVRRHQALAASPPSLSLFLFTVVCSCGAITNTLTLMSGSRVVIGNQSVTDHTYVTCAAALVIAMEPQIGSAVLRPRLAACTVATHDPHLAKLRPCGCAAERCCTFDTGQLVVQTLLAHLTCPCVPCTNHVDGSVVAYLRWLDTRPGRDGTVAF